MNHKQLAGFAPNLGRGSVNGRFGDKIAVLAGGLPLVNGQDYIVESGKVKLQGDLCEFDTLTLIELSTGLAVTFIPNDAADDGDLRDEFEIDESDELAASRVTKVTLPDETKEVTTDTEENTDVESSDDSGNDEESESTEDDNQESGA